MTHFGKYARENDFHYLLMATVILIAIAALLVSHCENMHIGDAVWWAIVTITTVGYGDISPHSLEGRCVAAVLMFFGIGLISSLTANIAGYMTRKRNERNYTWNAVQHISHRLQHFDSLSLNDLNEIHAVLVALKTASSKENQTTGEAETGEKGDR